MLLCLPASFFLRETLSFLVAGVLCIRDVFPDVQQRFVIVLFDDGSTKGLQMVAAKAQALVSLTT